MPEKQKKIIFISSTSERYKGGIAQFSRYLADQLATQHHLLFLSWFQLYPSFLISRDFRDSVSKTTTGKTAAEFLLGYCFPFSWWRTAKRIRAEQPDMVCIGWIHPVHSPIFLFLSWVIKRNTKAELVYICFNAKPHESFPGAGLLSRLVLSRADRLVAHGKSEADYLHSLAPRSKITRLFLPLRNFFQRKEKAIAAPANATRSGKRLLFFGLVRHYKGLDILLRALPTVLARHPDTVLHIAGESFYKKKSWFGRFFAEQDDVTSLIRKLGLEKNVIADLRYIPNEEIPEIFEASDVAVFPYRSATQSGVVAVAYGYNVPVIATRVGGLPDVILEGTSGALANPNDPADLARVIIEFLDNPISKKQVKTFAQLLSWERYLSGLVNDESFDVHLAFNAQKPDESRREVRAT